MHCRNREGVYGISQSHLTKVVQDLGQSGYVETVRGRHGGIRLRKAAADINLGTLVRHTEKHFDLVDCPSCLIAPACQVNNVFAQATRAFLAVLDQYTLADMMVWRNQLHRLFSRRSDRRQLAHGHEAHRGWHGCSRSHLPARRRRLRSPTPPRLILAPATRTAVRRRSMTAIIRPSKFAKFGAARETQRHRAPAAAARRRVRDPLADGAYMDIWNRFCTP